MYEFQMPYDKTEILMKRRKIKRELLALGTERIHVKIAILGGSTTDLMREMLEIFLLKEGIEPEFYVGEYGRYFEEASFENHELMMFHPDYIVFHTGTVNIKVWPQPDMREAEVQELVRTHMEELYRMWEKAEAYGSTIIQNNYEMPFIRLRGNMDGCSPSGWTRYVWLLNEKIYEYAQEHSDFLIHDICYLSAQCGMDQWFSTSQWYQAHLCPGTGAVVDYCYSCARLIASQRTGGKKVLITDLDQTLWPGIAAETRGKNLELDPETAIGEAHLDYQKYLLELQKTGVILCVASKNDREDALTGLSQQENLITADHFAWIKANWNPKDQSVKEIIEELNVLSDSVVFVDDSVNERVLVRENVPGTAVTEYDTIDQLLTVLSRGQFFLQQSITREDRLRADWYQKQQYSKKLESKYANYEAYLESLEMNLKIKRVKQAEVKRVLQLIGKTHRFHLSDTPVSERTLLEMLAQDRRAVWCAELNDQYMAHGIISCIYGSIQEEVFCIEQWVMSCRVFERGVEHAIMNAIISYCKTHKVKTILADYDLTDKNQAMEALLRSYGFQQDEKRTEDKGKNQKQFILNMGQYIENKHLIAVEELL